MLTSIQNITNKRKSRSISSFLLKTYDLLNQQQNNNVIKWASNGIGFIVINQQQFSKYVLPKYFKHSNYSSFVRQLNMYNFHKIRESNSQSYFHHECFDRSNQQVLCEIKRKPQKKRKNNYKNDNQNQSIQCFQYEDQCDYHNKTQETVNKQENMENKMSNQVINHINDNNYDKMIGNKKIKMEKENDVKKSKCQRMNKNSKKRMTGLGEQRQQNIYEQQQKQIKIQQCSKNMPRHRQIIATNPTTRQIFSSSLTITLQLQPNNNNIDFSSINSNFNITNICCPQQQQQQDDNDDKLSINNQIQQERILAFPTKQLMYPSKYNLFPFKNNQNNKFNVFY